MFTQVCDKMPDDLCIDKTEPLLTGSESWLEVSMKKNYVEILEEKHKASFETGFDTLVSLVFNFFSNTEDMIVLVTFVKDFGIKSQGAISRGELQY